jgi:hypothetical protein
MRIRLDVNIPTQPRYSFDHQGAAVRIGRDPEGELVFQGEACQCVSWNHACIELTTGGAFLSDLGSSNGTFVNDQRLAGRTPLRLGDRIRMGQTGPLLQVMDLQLSGPRVGPAAEVRAKQLLASLESGDTELAANGAPVATSGGFWATVDRLRWPLLIGAGVVAAMAFILLLVVLLRPGPGKAPDGGGTVSAPEARGKDAEGQKKELVAPNPQQGSAADPYKKDDQKKEDAQKPPAPEPPPPAMVPARTIGQYAAADKGPPSVLLQRQRDPDPWGRLKPDSRIQTGYYLLSLPGYRSKVRLDNGVILVLWGNLPEFSNFPPVLESSVMLNDPETGTDLDLTLDHGRVLVYNNKPKDKGSAKVRVRFHQEVWDLTLPDYASEVAIELWGQLAQDVPFSKEPGGKGPDAIAYLFAKGGAELKTKNQTYQLPNLSFVHWNNRTREVQPPARLGKEPDWWTDKLVPGKWADADAMMLALGTLADALAKTEAVVDGVWTQVTNADEEPVRRLGVLCLGALDALVELAQALEDGRRPLVRSSAIFALQRYISRGSDYELELYRTLQEKKKYPKDKAEIVLQLLHLYSRADLGRPETYQKLIGLLEHDSLPVRELALWHLTHMVPQGLKTIKFDPAGDSEARQKAVAEWKKLIPPGQVPPPPPGPGR